MLSVEALARRLWQVFEPVHAVTYFAPTCLEAPRALGLQGFWSGYVVQRAAPLGQVAAEAVAEAFFGFHPSRIAKAWPTDVSLEEALSVRSRAAGHVLRSIGATEDAADVAWEAAQRADTSGRPLASANQRLPRPADPVQALWQATTTLREHRGDGHVAALRQHGLSPVDAMLLKSAAGESEGEPLRLGRAWPDEQWRSDLVRDGELTPRGRELKQAVEDETDAAAADPWQHVDGERLYALLLPLATAVYDTGILPGINPIGVSRPS